METQRAWDYAGDNYVHRLIQSKTDGKLVELNSHCLLANDGCGSCECFDSGFSEAVLNSKVEAVMSFILYINCYFMLNFYLCNFHTHTFSHISADC